MLQVLRGRVKSCMAIIHLNRAPSSLSESLQPRQQTSALGDESLSGSATSRNCRLKGFSQGTCSAVNRTACTSDSQATVDALLNAAVGVRLNAEKLTNTVGSARTRKPPKILPTFVISATLVISAA